MTREVQFWYKVIMCFIRPKRIVSFIKTLLFVLVGYWMGRIQDSQDYNLEKSSIKSSSSLSHFIPVWGYQLELSQNCNNCSLPLAFPPTDFASVYLNEVLVNQRQRRDLLNLMNIGFITDGNNTKEMNEALKTLFLHRQFLDFFSFHILAPRHYWQVINEILMTWYQNETRLDKSFNHTLYDLDECLEVADVFQPYFDSVYRVAFCKLVFPYLLNPLQIPYLLLLDFDIVVVNHQFTTECWLKTIKKLDQNPLALFSIAHQGSPSTKRRAFPMPYIQEYKAYFHFNNGIILFHVARIHQLDQLKSESSLISTAYPVACGPRRWLRDFQQIGLKYLKISGVKHSLTQVLWNVYMVHRGHSFVQLNQGCNFQPCAQKTYVRMSDDLSNFPHIFLVHLWRACVKRNMVENSFFSKYYEALSFLPVNYVHRLNPTGLVYKKDNVP